MLNSDLSISYILKCYRQYQLTHWSLEKKIGQAFQQLQVINLTIIFFLGVSNNMIYHDTLKQNCPIEMAA